MTILEELNKIFLEIKGETFKPEDSLMEGQLIDSVDMVDIISFIEERFGIVIDAYDVTIENFDNISRMEHFINMRLSEKTSGS